MKIAIIGRTQILYETALRLHAEGHDIQCIITAKASPEYTRSEQDFEMLASTLGCTFFCRQSLNDDDVKVRCQDLQIDVAISMNWISIIEQEHIDLFRLGILNCHLGDLPRYRGNACPNWAILNGENQVMNTVHFMEGGKLDSGNIICQQPYTLGAETTITDIYEWTEKVTPRLFSEALLLVDSDNDYVLKYADSASAESQRCYPRLLSDSYINWDRSVADIHALIRATCFPFPGAYTYHWDRKKVRKLYILKSRIMTRTTNDYAMAGHVLENNRESGQSYIQCADGILGLLRCRYEGETEEFQPGKRWKSIRMRLGVRVEDWLWAIQNGDIDKS